MSAERKLATILAADVVGYSRLTAADEEGTHARFKASLTEVIDPAIAKYQGRIFQNTGDGFLAEFASAVNCVASAVEIQRRLGRRNQDVVADRRLEFRFGINIGDVIADGGDVYGGGVNVAVRLEGMCDPGGILVSDDAYRQVHDKLEIEFQDRGPQNLKNIEVPVRAYAVEMGSVAGTAPVTSGGQHPQRTGLAIAAVVVVAIVGFLGWQSSREPAPSVGETALLTLPVGPRVAVLPFDNLSGNAEEAFFSDGITEQIIAQLSLFAELSVLSRNSTFQYKSEPIDVRQLGDVLSADFVLEGSIQRSGEAVRVIAQLSNTANGEVLWAASFDRDLTPGNLFEVQDEIAQRVAAAVGGGQGRVTQVVNEQTLRKPPDSLATYECVLLAMEARVVLTIETLTRARDCLELAVNSEPEYAEAWASLSQMHELEVRSGVAAGQVSEDALNRAFIAAQEAVRLDPWSATAHRASALVFYSMGEMDRFLEEAEQTIALNPNDAISLIELGTNIAWSGDWEKGLAMLRRGMELTPNHPPWINFPLVVNEYHQRNYQQALALVREINMPELFWTHVHTATSNAQLGRTEEAQAAVVRLMDTLSRVHPWYGAAGIGEIQRPG